MRTSADFSSAVRHGRRVRRGAVVVHVLVPSAGPSGSAGASEPATTVGFIVAKSVGGSVVRHRVSRRLRAVMALRVRSLPAGSATVVRALPTSAGASSAELAVDLDAAFERLAAMSR